MQIIYRLLGPGTNWLGHRVVGETVDLLGPLGNGFAVEEDRGRPVVLIGGGVGLPPMFFLADRLARGGYEKVVAIAGSRSRDLRFVFALNWGTPS